MTKKMKRELKEVKESMEIIADAKKRFGPNSCLTIERYFTQKRADIADKIGRKNNN